MNIEHQTVLVSNSAMMDYLNEFGIRYLTGEADPMVLRGLFDLTPDGADIIARFLGGCAPTAPNHNAAGATRSMMLPYEMIKSLAIFCMTGKWDVVMLIHDDRPHAADFLVGVSNDDYMALRDHLEGAGFTNYRTYRRSGTGRDGTSNRHEMTGRVM